MKEKKEEKLVDEKEPIKLGAKEVCIILAIIAIVVLVFNSSKVKDIIYDNLYDDNGETFGITFDDDEYVEEETSGNYDYNSSLYEELEESNERLECFELKVIKNENADVFAVLNSTSNIPLTNIKLHIIFYDGEKRPISVETEYIDCLLPDGKWAGRLYDVNKNYETYDFLVEADNYDVEETVNLFKNITVSQVFGSDTNMSVRFENKTNKKVNAGAVAIYYDKNGNIADVERYYAYDLKANKTKDVESYTYLDYQQENYSGVEVILTDAYVE